MLKIFVTEFVLWVSPNLWAEKEKILDGDMGLGIPEWSAKEEKRGNDPLGMQTTSVALYQQLLPGVSNVTLRMRYYGFYAWLVVTYAKRVGDTSLDSWCQYLRRAEALYALAAVYHNEEPGVAGTDWAKSKLSSTRAKNIIFHPSTDRDSGKPQYLKQKFGAFGAAYGSQLVEVGILEYVDGHDIPVPTQKHGEELATAFESEIGDAAPLFWSAIELGKISIVDLQKLDVVLPGRIAKKSKERKLYEALLFSSTISRSHPDKSRRLSCTLALRVAKVWGIMVTATQIRWTLYSTYCSDRTILPPLPSDEDEFIFTWAVYHANDMLHACYEALMKYTLDALDAYPSGMDMEGLVELVVSQLMGEFQSSNYETWDDLVSSLVLAVKPGDSEEHQSEFNLLHEVLQGASRAAHCTGECAANALRLLALLYKRFIAQVEQIREICPVLVQTPFVQSLVTELRFIEFHAKQPLSTLLASIVRQRVIERHMWVAMQKFKGQGDYTFLFELDDGRVRMRSKAGPVLTNPRLRSALLFMRDIHLLGETGPTAIGKRLLVNP